MKCPLCLSKKTKIFHNKVWLSKGKVCRCMNCNVLFLTRPLKGKKEDEFYAHYGKHLKARGVVGSRDVTAFHRLSKDIARQRFKRIGNLFSHRDSVLEIGASTGAFLELLREEKKIKNICAVEPCLKNREYCQKFAQCYCDFGELADNQRFTRIIMFHVFEHFRSPEMLLGQCVRHLDKKGIIVMEVPHCEDPLISLYNCDDFKDFYFQPMHPFVYSLKALRYIASKVHLKVKKVEYYQRYGIDNHLQWLSKGRPGGDRQLQALFSKLPYRQALEKSKKTDTLFVILIKEN